MKRYTDRKGIALVWMALLLVALLGAAALSVDLAYMYFVKNELQVAADAAALAGGAFINDPTDIVQTEAVAGAIVYAGKNKAAGAPLSPEDTRVTVGSYFWKESENKGLYTPGGTPVNAIEVTTRRTARVFFGNVFDISAMNATGRAVAASGVPGLGPFPICITHCGMQTPLEKVDTNVTPGLRFTLKTESTPPHTGWTSFEMQNTSVPVVKALIAGQMPVPNACNICLNTNNGVQEPIICAVREKIQREISEGRGEHVVEDGNGNSFAIQGWRAQVPVLANGIDPTCTGFKMGCLGDPGYQPGDSFKIVQYADVIITDATPQGNCKDGLPLAGGDAGIVVVGAAKGASVSNSIIQCVNCDSPGLLGKKKTVLVE